MLVVEWMGMGSGENGERGNRFWEDKGEWGHKGAKGVIVTIGELQYKFIYSYLIF
jgi:hypothetical protein